MKFGKSLSSQIEETIPEWRDKFLSYKDLKKRLKLIVPRPDDHAARRLRLAADGDSPAASAAAAEAVAMTQEEVDFILLLEAELEKFNVFFVEMEEEYIIRQKELQVQMANAKECSEELMRIRKEIVDFHGEMVLLENYSALNYTGLVKILKKYDKRTGALIRLPFIQKVLQEPFFTTETLNKLIKECETMLIGLFPKPPISGSHDGGANSNCNDKSFDGPKDLSEIEYMESLYLRSTKSALCSLKEIRSGSSTVSVFSLPPLQNTGMEESWNKVSSPSLEQTATS